MPIQKFPTIELHDSTWESYWEGQEPMGPAVDANCVCGHHISRHHSLRGRYKPFRCIDCDCKRFRYKRR